MNKLSLLGMQLPEKYKENLDVSSEGPWSGVKRMRLNVPRYLSTFFELKRTLVYIHLQLRTRKVLDIQLVGLILQI
jgi:hypothetical protein